MDKNEPGNNVQRALWTFLGYMLLAPFFAGLLVTCAIVIAPLLNLSELLPKNLPSLGLAAVATYVWSVMPAALTSLIVAPLVIVRGKLNWIEAAIAGVIAFAVVTFFLYIPFQGMLPFLAFIAGLISIAVREALMSAKILKA